MSWTSGLAARKGKANVDVKSVLRCSLRPGRSRNDLREADRRPLGSPQRQQRSMPHVKLPKTLNSILERFSPAQDRRKSLEHWAGDFAG